MELYFAPLEGIGGYIHRNAQAAHFPKADKYFAPFLSPNQTMSFKHKEIQDVNPANNELVNLVPQLLTNNAEHFLWGASQLHAMGYDEINLNLGCPSKTVVTKGRGAGFLSDLEKLKTFLDRIYDQNQYKISIKTRIGMESEEEFGPLVDLYSQYPIHELIIHPRVQTDYYKNHPRMDAFDLAVAKLDCPICYNGDIVMIRDYLNFREKYPHIDRVMLGRGAMRNPGIFGECREADKGTCLLSGSGEATDRGTYPLSEEQTKDTSPLSVSSPLSAKLESLKAFHQTLMTSYSEHLSGDKTALYKLKETWFYMGPLFEDYEKPLKKIRKAQKLSEYRTIVNDLFNNHPLVTEEINIKGE